MDTTLTFGTSSLPPVFGTRVDSLSLPIPVSFLPSHEDFGVLVDTTNLFNTRVGHYRVVRPLDVLTYKNSDGYSSTFHAFPRIIGVGNTLSRARGNAINHLLHSRNFYEALPSDRGTEGAKRQGILIKQYLQRP